MRTVFSLIVLTSGHLLIDLASSLLFFTYIFQLHPGPEKIISLAVLYNVLAFATQPFLGFLIDKRDCPRLAGFLSVLIAAVSLILFTANPAMAVILACLGNSLYHVASGSLALKFNPNKSFYPGLVVASGAFGLFLGTLLSKSGQFPFLLLFFALLLIMVFFTGIRIPKNYYPVQKAVSGPRIWPLFLILFTVFIRSYVSILAVFTWKSQPLLLIILTLAVVLGKAVGGLLADKFGWRKVGIVSLLVSAPLITFGAGIPVLAIIGMFLFNFTMPVTLAAVGLMLPKRPGFAFGLTAFIIFLGLIPALLGISAVLARPGLLFIAVLVSVAALGSGLKIIRGMRYTK